MDNKCIITIPFHDWRKIEKEGSRTRDAQISIAFMESNCKVLIINRPTTWLEILLNRKGSIEGKVLMKSGGIRLIEKDKGLYVIDYISLDWVGQIKEKHLWFTKKYASKKFLDMIERSVRLLDFQDITLISHSVFGTETLLRLKAKKKIFDAYDNVLRFPFYSRIKDRLERLYQKVAADKNILWVSNSNENASFFKKLFGVKNIKTVINGARTDLFQKEYLVPEDMKKISKPWVGFGGKITHLFDSNLFNHLTKENQDLQFIIVGQVIDKVTFNEIQFRKNVHYLGDKTYSDYLAYACNFDVAIVPYKVEDKAHGGSSIKAFEYVSAKLKTVGTIGNGLEDLEEYIYLTNNYSQFSNFLNDEFENKLDKTIDIPDFSWKSVVKEILSV